ncbi:MAG TPA: c-type cytochrome [Planctomycetota bacterium]|nr:c-type cytochrome [Planctomycetota bacterium]
MRETMAEIGAGLLTLAGIIAATFYPFVYEAKSVEKRLPPGAQVITLTGVAATGTWTEENVDGGNYWYRHFAPARPVLRVGQPTLLRLKSADVNHSFYCPGLAVGPLEVHPGHVLDVLITPIREGVFEFYCTTICGDPHFGMRGQMLVLREGSPIPAAEPAKADKFWQESPPPPGQSHVARGAWLFHRNGCFTCHGVKGKGGVPNWNYIKDTIPPLSTLAERMLIPDKEGADAIVGAMERAADLKTLSSDPPFARFNAFLAQYQSVKDVIRKGNPPGKKDPKGLPPPLEMLPFGMRLSDRDIDDLIAYLLTLEPWEGGDK